MIRTRGLTKRYGAVTAVDDVSFDVENGELLALVGGSGSGKTTTLKIVNRLIEPTCGSVEVDGEDTAGRPGHLLRRKIGYVFQRLGLFPRMTVAENVAVVPKLLGWTREQTRDRVDELLELLELGGALRDRLPDSLSGGQQQRVGLARALAARPKVMLLDEPFGALDALTRDRLQRVFDRIRRQQSITAVFVTHDLSEAFQLADRIGVMRDGRLLQLASPAELVKSPADDYVHRLLDTPRQQARVFQSISAGALRA
jgi:osmoprotectant transport system ATP-binding protein